MTVRIINADVLAGLAQLPESSVHCVVTSPPYWGLRDYGTGQWEGGDAECEHRMTDEQITRAVIVPSTLGGGKANQANAQRSRTIVSPCPHCGARRIDDQIGLEPTLAEHIERLVGVFEQVRRVLRPDGVLFLNYGDAYATGLKPKDLCLIPHRLAIALQDAGWWVRSDIIWAKPNPMPESVTDRPTNAHEHVFLLTKRSKYWWDAEAVREKSDQPDRVRADVIGGASWQERQQHSEGGEFNGSASRNLRNVWTIPSYPFSEAHFATFPPKLVETCLKAGCPERVCADCGAPYVREVERGELEMPDHRKRVQDIDRRDVTDRGWNDEAGFARDAKREVRTLGFSPSCDCQQMYPIPAGTCLDPFGGSGTTGMVADRMNRNAILIELNSEYAEMARKRVEGDSPLFATVELGP